jgi:hypothetical protein
VLRVVGGGLGRTGTGSLKVALEQLLGAPCYHMREVFSHEEHVPVWHAAARGEMPDWHAFLGAYAAAVDWPAVSFWPELSDAFPDAIVLVSTRDRERWWESVASTILEPICASLNGAIPGLEAWSAMVRDLFTARFTPSTNKDDWLRTFDDHYARVRAAVPSDRLVEWTTGDGWEPLCRALDMAVPDEPFPWENKREDWGRRR